MSHNDERRAVDQIAGFVETLSGFTDAELLRLLVNVAKELNNLMVSALLIESARRLRTRALATEETP